MIGINSGVVSVLNIMGVLLTLLCLVLFGAWYNRQIDKWGKDAEGYAWLQVALGVIVTIAGAGILNLFIEWNAFFVDLLAFTASGIPMITGDIRRYLAARRRLNSFQKELRDDTTETLAN